MSCNFVSKSIFLGSGLQLHQNHPELFAANQNIARNEGALVGKGQKLWKRAKQVIPGQHAAIQASRDVFARAMAGVFQ